MTNGEGKDEESETVVSTVQLCSISPILRVPPYSLSFLWMKLEALILAVPLFH